MARKSSVHATRSDGIHSRETILNAAARLATVEGLEGMSIGRLAEYIGMSKSGLYAHFGSKEELQLATVERANEIFQREVIRPTEGIAGPLERLQALCNQFLDHLARDVFPGGCFFISAVTEFDTRPGAVRDLVKETTDAWVAMFTALLSEAQSRGVISEDVDPGQLAWELDSYLVMANLGWVLSREPLPLQRAREAIQARLADARPAVPSKSFRASK
jgi:AcrR family transcriptional regulator